MTFKRFLYLTVILTVEYRSTQNFADLILNALLVTVSSPYYLYFFSILAGEGPFVGYRPRSDSGRGLAPTVLAHYVLVSANEYRLGDHATFRSKIVRRYLCNCM